VNGALDGVVLETDRLGKGRYAGLRRRRCVTLRVYEGCVAVGSFE
jgi:hypothetical protein